jgi:hypothetical protein
MCGGTIRVERAGEEPLSSSCSVITRASTPSREVVRTCIAPSCHVVEELPLVHCVEANPMMDTRSGIATVRPRLCTQSVGIVRSRAGTSSGHSGDGCAHILPIEGTPGKGQRRERQPFGGY